MNLSYIKKLTVILLFLSIPTFNLSAAEKDAPASVDELFGTSPSPEKKSVPVSKDKEPASVDELFGTTPSTDKKPAATSTNKKDAESVDELFATNKKKTETSTAKVKGFWQGKAAYTYAHPGHWSKLSNQVELATQGRLSDKVQWKLSGRAAYDAVYDATDFYPSEVRDDQRFELTALENYIDISSGNWDFRLGRQHIVWGEMVGLFFADVVSAKDLREFILPEFDQIRIPQWAARAEWFKNDFHAEAIWIPVMTYDKIGKPGAEFYPYPLPPPAGYATVIQHERKPNHGLSDSAYGLRLSYLKNGWDTSGFFYRSVDSSPTFYRRVVTTPTPAFVFQPDHDKISQLGFTVAKDFSSFVLKGEAIYTKDKRFNVNRLTDDDGVVKQNIFDYIVGLEFSYAKDTMFNVQFYQRWFQHHDPDIIPDRVESGVSLYVSSKFLRSDLETQLLLIHSLNRNDWMVRPKVIWSFAKDWRLSFGIDAFGGPQTGLFGQYNNKDRVYTELRYLF